MLCENNPVLYDLYEEAFDDGNTRNPHEIKRTITSEGILTEKIN